MLPAVPGLVLRYMDWLVACRLDQQLLLATALQRNEPKAALSMECLLAVSRPWFW